MAESDSTVSALNWFEAAKFWSRVSIGDINACWPYKGCIDSGGYGSALFFGTTTKANRIAFFLANGHFPREMACHKCDNPACCNPFHIVDGSAQYNRLDSILKGRDKKRKLLPQQVRAIRELRKRGVTLQFLADWFGMSECPVRLMLKGKTYRDII